MKFKELLQRMQSVLTIHKKNTESMEIQKTTKSSQMIKANEEAPIIFFDQIDNYDELLSQLSTKMQLVEETDVLAVLSLIFQNENYFDQHTIKISSGEITPSQVILTYEVPILNETNKISIETCHDGVGFLYSIKDETNRQFEYQCILTSDDVDSECLTATIGSKIQLIPVLRLFQSWDESNAVFTCKMKPNEISFSFWNKFFVENNCDDTSYNINLIVQKPLDEENNGYVYIPKNKEMLETYLQNLKFPVRLEKVYKDICMISFGDNINKYPLFDLYIFTQKFSKKYGFTDGIFTDIITLENGKLVTFGLTYPNDSQKDNSLLAVVLGNNKKIDYVQYTEDNGFEITNGASLDEAKKNIDINAISFVSAKAVRTFSDLYQDVLIVNSGSEDYQKDMVEVNEDFIQESFIEENALQQEQSGPRLVKKLTPPKQDNQ